jgi:RNA polymerase sigma factor (sigma-70 family)
MQDLTPRERDLIEAKYFYDKKLKDISVEFNISQSRISRIIQNGLNKIKKELLKQENVDEDDI